MILWHRRWWRMLGSRRTSRREYWVWSNASTNIGWISKRLLSVKCLWLLHLQARLASWFLLAIVNVLIYLIICSSYRLCVDCVINISNILGSSTLAILLPWRTLMLPRWLYTTIIMRLFVLIELLLHDICTSWCSIMSIIVILSMLLIC